MSEFNIEDLDEVIASTNGSLSQMLALQLRKQLQKFEELQQKLTESERYGRQADITIENLERKVEQLAAENAGLKAAIPPLKNINDVTDSWDDVSLAEEVGFNYAVSTILKSLPETPATSAILAEVRASGADECVRQLVISDADDDFCDAPNVCAMVAHQIRQGAAK